jgi:hypothetical protein
MVRQLKASAADGEASEYEPRATRTGSRSSRFSR